MKISLIALALAFISQVSHADNISIDCKNTKIPGIQTIQLQNSEDFGRSGSTSSGRNWFVNINSRPVKNAYVQVIKRGVNVSGFKVTFTNERSLFFAMSGDSKAFVFLLSPAGTQVSDTISYCSMGID